MHLPRVLKSDRSWAMDSKHKRRKPRLERRNAVKNIDYDGGSPSPSPDNSSTVLGPRTRLLDLPPYTSQTSFRIDGVEGEFERICRNLGLSGPEDFAIPAAAWEARKARSSTELLPKSRLNQPSDCPVAAKKDAEERGNEQPDSEGGEDPGVLVEFASRVWISEEDSFRSAAQNGFSGNACPLGVGGGIKGVRPPLLTPPPAMSLPALDRMSSTWDIVRSLAPDDGVMSLRVEDEMESEEDEEIGGLEDDGRQLGLGETAELTGSCSFSTSNDDDDDDSSTTTETMFTISPNGRFRRSIRSWIRGTCLGSGSFGTVYEGISDDGFFFAVKEVSLLDQGSKAQQCIFQLEQEIALLSQFEHENIVQYLGTDKEEARLYIFLELATQGSLAFLYQKYRLRDSQVSAYTRQILNGLKYLHDRDVIHRDIKCANILVDASGSVKLADFGLAKQVVNPRKGYGLAADIWSLGCAVLEMLTHQLPYSNLEWTQALFKIGRGEPPTIPNSLSTDARDFIQQCLRVKPDERLTASQLLDHPFVKRSLPGSGSASPYNKRRS
ncbi:mitogen-activated protein kinase kinase kinase 1-like isoform X2 [Aristolochia californica]|uniref:mitogen-activated protein kinase kinase kinase 1-like isoform X2 n=1 Tax=Aristolochia californica TaxID=171875 RepID=UPI0035D7EA09